MGEAAKDLLDKLKGAASDLIEPFSEEARLKREREQRTDSVGKRQPGVIGTRG